MALIINSLCIACDVCRVPCPNKAITVDAEDTYTIDPERCTECVGHFSVSQCVKVCPVRAIVPDPAHSESREELQKKSEHLKAQKVA